MVVRPKSNLLVPVQRNMVEDMAALVETTTTRRREFTFDPLYAPGAVTWMSPIDIDFRPEPAGSNDINLDLTGGWDYEYTVTYLAADGTVLSQYTSTGSMTWERPAALPGTFAFNASYAAGVGSRSFFGEFARLRIEYEWTPADIADKAFGIATEVTYWTSEGRS